MKTSTCDSWDARFFAMADLVASWSEDPSRKVGAVIVGGANQVVSTGYNGLPRGVSDQHPERLSRDDGAKYLWIEHAERNALYNMLRAGVSTKECRMYCNSFPCADCSRAIVQSGIGDLRTYSPDMTDQKYGKHFRVALDMFEEAGVEVRLYSRQDEKIDQVIKSLSDARQSQNNFFR